MLKLPPVYDFAVMNDWFLVLNLILKMNGYLAACFYKFHVLEKQQLIKTIQPDRPSQVGLWSKILWKTATKKSITF